MGTKVRRKNHVAIEKQRGAKVANYPQFVQTFFGLVTQSSQAHKRLRLNRAVTSVPCSPDFGNLLILYMTRLPLFDNADCVNLKITRKGLT